MNLEMIRSQRRFTNAEIADVQKRIAKNETIWSLARRAEMNARLADLRNRMVRIDETIASIECQI